MVLDLCLGQRPKREGREEGRAAPEREGGRLYDVLAIAGNRRAARAERERERAASGSRPPSPDRSGPENRVARDLGVRERGRQRSS